jgi:hypothetical protein
MYLGHWRQFVSVSASGAGALLAIFAIPLALGTDLRDETVMAVLVILVGSLWTFVGLSLVAHKAYINEPVSLPETYRNSFGAGIAFLGVVTAVAVAMAFVLIVPIAGIFVALYLFVRLSLSFEAAVAGHVHPIKAVRSMWMLTRGQFGRALLHTAVLQAMIWAATIIMILLPHMFTLLVLAVIASPVYAIYRMNAYFDLAQRVTCPHSLYHA